MSRPKIAIIGSGIAGLTAASKLHPDFDIQLYEYNDYLGGHTNTHDVTVEGVVYPVNTGFIVYNDWVYSNFNALMAPLAVERQAAEMSFSISDEVTGLEYNGRNLDTLFAQRRNLWSPKFYRMVADIIRFNRLSTEDLAADRLTADITIGQYLNRHKLGAAFTAQYIIPMGAAIWSTDEATILDLPALFFIRFFNNHGLLSVTNRPQWYVLKGGSRSYVAPLTEPFAERVHLNSRIDRVERRSDGVTLHFADGAEHNFDQVVFACHSDQALALLAEPTDAELSVLGAMKYADNDVVLHTDEALLPKQKKVWAAWNYHLGADKSKPASLTYNMNILQSFDSAPVTFCVTLNRTELIDPDKIIARFNYAHPVFSRASLAAQARYADIGNTNRSHFCGAYWFNGFHEDGVNSALRVVDDLHNRPHTAAKHRHESERVAEHE